MAPIIRASETRRLAGVGRVRAVLRLGKRADAGPPRRAVLAPRRGRRGRAGARAGLRHRPRVAAARARRRGSRRHRSVGADARPRAPATHQVANPPTRSNRCVSSAATSARCRSRTSAFPMVIAPYGILQSLIRPRDLTATLASVARVVAPRRHVRHRSGARRAEVARVREPRAAARPRRRRAAHAHRVGPAGSEAAPHDVRAEVRRAARRRRRGSTGST